MRRSAQRVFDVPGWIASFSGDDRSSVRLVAETRNGGAVRLRYSVGEEARTAEVVVRTMRQPRGRVVGWEIVGWVHGDAQRIEVPAGTRFEWR